MGFSRNSSAVCPIVRVAQRLAQEGGRCVLQVHLGSRGLKLQLL